MKLLFLTANLSLWRSSFVSYQHQIRSAVNIHFFLEPTTCNDNKNIEVVNLCIRCAVTLDNKDHDGDRWR